MIETWNIAPPEPRRHIVHIAKLDLDLFGAPVIAAAATVQNLQVIDGEVRLTPPRVDTTRMSYSTSTPYLVTFSDGAVARCSRTTVTEALAALGQTWPERS